VTSKNSRVMADNARQSELLSGIAGGSRAAFTALYRELYAPLTRFVYRYLDSQELTEEVVNDTMLIVWQKAGSFDGNSRVTTWVMGIAVRQCANARRRGAKHRQTDPLEEDLVAADANVDEQMATQQLVAAALSTLSAEHRATIELSYGHGYSCAEIAGIMACPVNTVKTRLHHARRHLRGTIDELRSGDPGRQRGYGDRHEH